MGEIAKSFTIDKKFFWYLVNRRSANKNTVGIPHYWTKLQPCEHHRSQQVFSQHVERLITTAKPQVSLYALNCH